jgi:cell division protein FtsB
MEKKPKNKRSRVLNAVIAVLIVLVFCFSLIVTVDRLAEYRRKLEEKERLEEQLGEQADEN